MKLSLTTHTIEGDLAGAASPAPMCFAAFTDFDQNEEPVNKGVKYTAFSGTTDVELVSAPSADIVREIDSIHIHNADNAAVTVKVWFDDETNEPVLYYAVLQTLESAVFTKESGWQTLTAAGLLKTSAIVADDSMTEAKTPDSDGTSGLYLKKHALVTYDFAADGGAQGAITLADPVTIPDNAVCFLESYDVLTTCTPDTATIKLNLVTDGDLSTAIAVNDAKNPWDAGVFVAAGGGDLGAFETAPTPQKTTAARLVQVTVATADVTAGKIVFCVSYWVSQ